MENLLAHCSIALSQHQSLLLTLFLAGLTGGFTHCLTMCGPFAACGPSLCGGCSHASSPSRNDGWVKALNLPYHLGRVFTYGVLGLVVAVFAHQLTGFAFWKPLSATLLVLAGLMFVVSSLYRGGIAPQHKIPAFAGMTALLKFFSTNSALHGVLLGFMPCGLLYAALMMTATSAHPLAGMVGMWLFASGTMPALWVASLGAEAISRRGKQWVGRAGRVMLACNGVSLFIIAGNLMHQS